MSDARTPPESPPLLWVQDLRKWRRGQGHQVRIGVPDLRVPRGGLVAVCGDNGSGKSTLLDLLALVLAPDRVGRLELLDGAHRLDLKALDRRHTAWLRRRHLAYVPQHGGLLPWLSLEGNLRLAAHLGHGSPGEVIKVAESLDLTRLLCLPPARVSGGERRRAALARALLQRPLLLLVDEPTADQDPGHAQGVMAALADLTRTGSAVVLVTPDAAALQGIACVRYRFVVTGLGTGILDSTLEPLDPASPPVDWPRLDPRVVPAPTDHQAAGRQHLGPTVMTDQPRQRTGGPDAWAAPGSGRGDWRLVAGLAVADLRYDWMLSLCMTLALAAVSAPLLILLGLQAGFIGHQFERLQRDPGMRLVTPRVILRDPIDAALAAGLAARAAVVIPAPEAYLTLDIAGLADAATALPSATDDPLLVEHALTPGHGARWAVLSERLARESGVGPGGTLVVHGVAGAAAGIDLPLPVLGVLSEAAVGWVTRLWVPLPLFRQLSDGSRGLAVPELGLAATAPPVTDRKSVV